LRTVLIFECGGKGETAMRHPNTSRAFRTAALLLSLAVFALALFPAFYIAAEAHHDCCGEDCPVCECLRLCEAALRGVSGGTAARPCAVLFFFLVLLADVLCTAAFPRETPVSRKVRLNN